MSNIIRQKERGSLVVISGPSGAGKDTVVAKYLRKRNKNKAWLSVSCTSRAMRPGDKEGKSYYFLSREKFEEKISNGDFLEYALYNDNYYGTPKSEIEDRLNNGINVILDRYVFSNMAHQGGKIENEKERNEMYEWLYKLEVELLELPLPDIKIFIHMPFEATCILKNDRAESLDQNEESNKHLKDSIRAYIEIAEKYDFKVIEAIRNNNDKITRENIKSIDEISDYIDDVIFL